MDKQSQITNDSLLQVKFVTKQEKFAVSDIPYYVPAIITTVGLNELLNELINEDSDDTKRRKIQFDFIVNGELLRSKLSEHIFEHHVSTEHEVCIEYIEATPAPEPLDCLQHDDWVSAVHSSNKWILSGCYDNSVHIWSTKGKHLLTSTAHSGPIKGVSWISYESSIATFVSVSHDQTAILWEWNIENNSAKPLFVCRGHERSINCVDVRSSELVFVTGGWDCTIKLWSADINATVDDTDEEMPMKKKLKSERSNVMRNRVPKSTIQGHKEAISDIQWTDSDEIMSGSWDHTVKLWDAEYGGVKTEIIVNKSIFSTHYSVINNLILVSNADRHIRLYDPRSNGSIVKKIFTSHKTWVQTVKWSSTDSNLFVSGSYDNDLKLWDIRSGNTPLYDLLGHENKILCCDWSKPDTIISGSSDCTLRLFKMQQSETIS